MNILHLTLKKKWFDMVASGEKKEEYRNINKHWIERLTWHEYHKMPELELMKHLRSKEAFKKNFDVVEFKNGYTKESLTMFVEFKGIHWGSPKVKEWIDQEEWDKGKFYICIELGEILQDTP